MLVSKPTGKKFKSGRRINTVKGETINPHTNKPSYTFEEDDSIVDVRSCQEVDPESNYAKQELAQYR